MCPMRFILVLASLVVASYLLCKAFWMNGEDDPISKEESDATEVEEKGVLKRGYTKFVSGMWTLVDMASGRYLWRTMALQENEAKAKSH